MGNINRIPFVSALNYRRRPSDIARFIVSVDANPVESESIRTLSHVCQKVMERLAPLFVHGYSAASVILIASRLRVVAAMYGVLPSFVGSTVGNLANHGSLGPVTMGASGSSASAQVATKYNRPIAAVTNTEPSVQVSALIKYGYNSEFSKPLSSKVYIASGMPIGIPFNRVAAAALTEATNKIRRENYFVRSAITDAKPSSGTLDIVA